MEKLVEAIKTAALEAINNSKPIEIHFGIVTNDKPLEITIDNIPYDEDFLIISRNVTDYKTEISFDNISREATIYNALKVEEKVILLRFQKGQEYLVYDRVMN